MATFEEANKCPKCGNQMEATLYEEDPIIKRKLFSTECLTEGCEWFRTGRIIQTDNGTVYERAQGERGQSKSFPVLSPSELAAGQRMVEDAVNADLRDTGRPS
jgi:hypothetical protein